MRLKTFYIFIIAAIFAFVGTASGVDGNVSAVYTLAMGNRDMMKDENMTKDKGMTKDEDMMKDKGMTKDEDMMK